MFEDSLIESAGRIRTRSRYFAVGSFALQATLLAALALYPFLHPATLPKQALATLLMAPPVPQAPASLPQRSSVATHAQPILLENPLAAPIRIPQHAAMNVTDNPPPSIANSGLEQTGSGTGRGLLDVLGTAPPPVVKPVPPKGPVHVSSGVAAGQLLAPIHPVYPAIAIAARIQGTVIVEAVITKDGFIQKLRVVSGPSMLQQAAMDAIVRARYRPFLLNGDPVEVETTINVIFTLGGS
jgi:protein TonB